MGDNCDIIRVFSRVSVGVFFSFDQGNSPVCKLAHCTNNFRVTLMTDEQDFPTSGKMSFRFDMDF